MADMQSNDAVPHHIPTVPVAGCPSEALQRCCFFTMLFCKAGFSPDLESTRMWEASLENAKQPPFGICDIRSIWLQVPSFPRARPRMCRREDWVAALSLIEAHSHTLSSFRRIKLYRRVGAGNFHTLL